MSDGSAVACLTPAEVQTAKAFYSGPTDHVGKPLYYGWALGSEAPGPAGWAFTEATPNHEPAFDGLFKWVFGPAWDWRSFDAERDMTKVDAVLGPDLNGVTEGDLRAFRARGGKLILYQGWADTLVAPAQTIAFYERQSKALGRRKSSGYRPPVPCPRGSCIASAAQDPALSTPLTAPLANPPTATAQDDLFAALAQWVETGDAPAKVIATRYIDNTPAKGIAMQRPLCPFPQKAWYRGTGETKDAANFVCAVKMPER